VQAADWKAELKQAFRRPADLLAYLGIDSRFRTCGDASADQFSMLVPRHYANRMVRGDPRDPLLAQVLPHDTELLPQPGFSDDPVDDNGSYIAQGLLQKYRGRALVLATSACAVHCRYCFRRHFGPSASTATSRYWPQVIDQLSRDSSIREVILSGGDPLILDDDELTIRMGALARVPHLRRLRVHTRLPVVLPSRITGRLTELLATTRLRAVMVLHVNHPNEIDDDLASALRPLRECGIALLNQAVLLKGVNDSPQALIALSERLFDIGVLPYYLHLLDRVRGAAHFELEESSVFPLYGVLQAELPGYLLPRLVREIPGAGFKVPFLA